jgi:molybdopterin converting factor small subunit
MTAGAVEVRLAGLLARYAPADGAIGPDGAIRVAPGRSVVAVAAEIGIPPRQSFVAVVNGRTSDLSYILAPGDRLTLLPPIAGG